MGFGASIGLEEMSVELINEKFTAKLQLVGKETFVCDVAFGRTAQLA